MKKAIYVDPAVSVIRLKVTEDILLLSDAEIDIGDLIDDDPGDTLIDIDSLFN